MGKISAAFFFFFQIYLLHLEKTSAITNTLRKSRLCSDLLCCKRSSVSTISSRRMNGNSGLSKLLFSGKCFYTFAEPAARLGQPLEFSHSDNKFRKQIVSLFHHVRSSNSKCILGYKQELKILDFNWIISSIMLLLNFSNRFRCPCSTENIKLPQRGIFNPTDCKLSSY